MHASLYLPVRYPNNYSTFMIPRLGFPLWDSAPRGVLFPGRSSRPGGVACGETTHWLQCVLGETGSMRLLRVVLLTLGLFLIASLAVWADGSAPVEAPVCLSDAGGQDVTLLIDASGRALVIWRQAQTTGDEDPEGLAKIMVASAPEWEPETLWVFSPDAPGQARLIKGGAGDYVGWSEALTRTRLINRVPLAGDQAPLSLEQPYAFRWASVLDSQGHIHSAWASEAAITCLNSRDALSLTVPLSEALSVGALALAVDGTGLGHLAWETMDELGRSTGVFYAATVSGTVPLQVAPEGFAPLIVAGPTGKLHLTWFSQDGLGYVSSDDWGRSFSIGGPPRQNPLVLVAGPAEEVYVIWADGHDLWQTASLDWENAARCARSAEEIASISGAVDELGRLHLAWATVGDAGPGGVYYLAPRRVGAQLRVALPPGRLIDHRVPVAAESNLPASEMERVEFYLEEDSGFQADLTHRLIVLSTDTDGRDGWNAQLDGQSLNIGRYRVLALGTTRRGQILRSRSDWFLGGLPSSPWIMTKLDDDCPMSRQSHLDLAFPVGAKVPPQIGLYLSPIAPDAVVDGEPFARLLQDARFVGSYALTASVIEGRTFRLSFDSRRVPDGRYVALLALWDSDGQRTYSFSGDAFVIDNTLAPLVRVLLPRHGQLLQDNMVVSALVDDPDDLVERVEFYLENTLLDQADGDGGTFARVQRIWLGSDTRGADGWALNVSLDPSWDGDYWRVRALAFDGKGHLGTGVSSGNFTILARERPVLQLGLLAGQRVRGNERITLSIPAYANMVRGVKLYLCGVHGAIVPLGDMARSADPGRWLFDWDTQGIADGQYDVVALADDGVEQHLTVAQDILVDNSPVFRVPAAQAATVSVSATIAIRLEDGRLDKARAAAFYLQDAGGQLLLLGADHQPDNGLGIIWSPRTVLDGDYELVAVVTDTEGSESWIAQDLRVHSEAPLVRFVDWPRGPTIKGIQTVDWQTAPPANPPISVTLSYSCDGGLHWQLVAAGLGRSGPLRWDTRRWPDAPQALLRLVAWDGVHYAHAISPVFALCNRNTPPCVSLLCPELHGEYSQSLHIAWFAQDDEDSRKLQIDLDYCDLDGSWRPLAQAVPNSGVLEWDISALLPGAGYQVRIRAIDSEGESSTDIVEDIAIVSNTSPQVRLLWPIGKVNLEGDTVIMWHATDRDGDELSVDLYYSYDAGLTWLPLAENVRNTGFYQWQLSFLPPTGQYRVRVIARDERLSVSDESRDVFTVGKRVLPTVSFLSSLSDAPLVGNRLIRWLAMTSDHSIVRVSLRVRRRGEITWTDLAQNLPGLGSYVWNTAAFPDGQYDIQAVAVADRSSATASLTKAISLSNGTNLPPEVRMSSPVGGMVWSGLQVIRWEAHDPENQPITATLAVRPMGASIWQTIGRANGRTGSALWDTSRVTSGRYYEVRVVVTDGKRTGVAQSSGPVFVAQERTYPPALRIISPDASGALMQGDTVAWLSEDADGDPIMIYVEASQDGGSSWEELAGGIYDAGEYVLESGLMPGSSYSIRVTARDQVYGVQAVAIALARWSPTDQGPTVEILAPRRWDTLSGEQQLRWRARDPYGAIPRVQIDVSDDGGVIWKTLARNLDSSGSFAWDTSQWPNASYYVRFTADNGRQRTSVLRGPTSILNSGRHAPVVSILAPTGLQRWSGHQQVCWSSWDDDGDELTFQLDYRVDGDRFWHKLAQGIRRTDCYLVDTSVMPNARRAWLRITARDGTFEGAAETVQPFEVTNARMPSIELLAPTAGAVCSGILPIAWRTAWSAASATVNLDFSVDLGKTWHSIADGLPSEGTYRWNTRAAGAQRSVWLRASAGAGRRSVSDVLFAPVLVVGNAPRAELPMYLR